MTWDLIGRLVVCGIIVSAGILIIYANVNYNPNNDGA